MVYGFDRPGRLIRPAVFCGIQAVPGTLNYVEGQVTIAGRPVTPNSVGSVQLAPNQALAVERGKAEILLTPGVFLRLGDNSAVRFISGDLADIRVELLGGEAIVEANQVFKDSNIHVLLDGASVKLVKHGLYKFSAPSGQVAVLDGKVEVQRGDQHVDLKKGHELLVANAQWKPSKFDTEGVVQQDPLYAWSRLRSEYDAEASLQSASLVATGGPDWWGPGWYWNPGWDMYSYLPGEGILYSPFGWPYYSPGFVYLSPGFGRYGYGRGFYGHGTYGQHGFAGRGFEGRGGRVSPAFHSGGFGGRGLAASHAAGGFGGRGGFGGGFGGGRMGGGGRR